MLNCGRYGTDPVSGKVVGVVWHAAYWGMLASARMMCLVPFDWLKCAIFGRDSSGH
jgi:NADH dehydrogenase FAD-containing subunit